MRKFLLVLLIVTSAFGQGSRPPVNNLNQLQTRNFGDLQNFGEVQRVTAQGKLIPYPAAANTDVARGAALIAAFVDHVNGDTIKVGNGVFEVSTTLQLRHANLEGAGMNNTTVRLGNMGISGTSRPVVSFAAYDSDQSIRHIKGILFDCNLQNQSAGAIEIGAVGVQNAAVVEDCGAVNWGAKTGAPENFVFIAASGVGQGGNSSKFLRNYIFHPAQLTNMGVTTLFDMYTNSTGSTVSADWTAGFEMAGNVVHDITVGIGTGQPAALHVFSVGQSYGGSIHNNYVWNMYGDSGAGSNRDNTSIYQDSFSARSLSIIGNIFINVCQAFRISVESDGRILDNWHVLGNHFEINTTGNQIGFDVGNTQGYSGWVVSNNYIKSPNYGFYLINCTNFSVENNVVDAPNPLTLVSCTAITQHNNHKPDGTVVGTPTPWSFAEGGNGNVASFVQTTNGTFTIPTGTRLARSSSTSSVTFNLPVISTSHPTGLDILVRNEAGGGTGVLVKDSGGSTVATVGVNNSTRFVPTVAPSTWVAYPANTAAPLYNGQSQTLSAATTITTASSKDFKVNFGGGGILDVGTNGSVGQLGFYGATLAAKPTGNVLSGLSTLGLVGSPTIAFADVTGLGTAAALTAGTAAGNVPVLDGAGKILTTELPASSTTFKGVWNANTNSPTITSSTGTLGWFYLVNVAGSTTIDGLSSWAVGDQIIFDGSVWKQIAAASLVTSVAGRTGAVTITEADITDATALGRNIGKVTSVSAAGLLRLNADDSVTARTYTNIKTDLSLGNVANTTDASKQVASAIAVNSGPTDTGNDLIVADGDTLSFRNYDGVSFGSGKAALFRTGLGLGSIVLQSDTSTSTAIQKGNGTGGFTPAVAGTDYLGLTSGSAIQKANGSGGLTPAVAGTDFIAATSGSAVQKANGSGGLADAVRGTDFAGIPVVTTVAYSSTVTPAIGTVGVTTTYIIGALTNNITIAAPTGTPIDGQVLKLRLLQDSTGGRSVTWNSAFVFGTDITAAMEPNAANAVWRRAFEYNAATSKWECVGLVRGF